MSSILNLTLKKDVFESIRNGSSNDIFIEKTDYWEKRLTDPKTGEFKVWDIVRISSGSQEKLDYPVQTVVLNIENQYMITVKRDVKPEEKEVEVIVDKETKEVEVKVVKKEYETPKLEVKVTPVMVNIRKENVKKEADLKTRVKELVDKWVKNPKVFVVPTPVVNITPDGRILGTTRKLVVDMDLETRMELVNDETVLLKGMNDDEFVSYLDRKLKAMSAGNYVFVCLKTSGWSKHASGEDVYVLNVAVRKTYMFGRR